MQYAWIKPWDETRRYDKQSQALNEAVIIKH